MRSLFVIVLLGWCLGLTYAHLHRSDTLPCAHDTLMHTEEMQHLREQSADAVQQLLENRRILGRADSVLRVPVVWHVLYSALDAALELSRADIEQEMIYLNEWFSGLNEGYTTTDYFSDVVARPDDLKIEFYLADEDPNGESFDGINWVLSSVADSCDQVNTYSTAQGGQDLWDTSRYYNIYTCAISLEGVLGWSFLPSIYSHDRDGTVVSYLTVGSPEFGGSTLAHETGHFLGLPHTFNGDSCQADDEIVDTPNTDQPAYNYVPYSAPCPDFPTDPVYERCNNIVMLKNVMEYNYEQCMSYFSKDQAALMRSYLQSDKFSRKTLTNSPALPATCDAYDCTGKTCGPDGCGGVCGECSSQYECSPDQICIPTLPENTICTQATLLQPTLAGVSITADNTDVSGSSVQSCRMYFLFLISFLVLFSPYCRLSDSWRCLGFPLVV